MLRRVAALPLVLWLSTAWSPAEAVSATPEVATPAGESATREEPRATGAEEKAPGATGVGAEEPATTPAVGATGTAPAAGAGTEEKPGATRAGEGGASGGASGASTPGAGPAGLGASQQPAARPRPRWWGPEPRPKVSGYGGPALRLSGLHGAFAALVGLEGGINVMQRVTVGASLLWLLNPVEAGSFARGAATRVNLNYGGLVVDVSYVRGRRVAGTIGGLIGGGGACLQNPNNGDCADRTGFFVGEPRAGLRVILAPVVRLHVGLGYRLIAGRGWSGPPNARLGGPSAAVTLEFGWF